MASDVDDLSNTTLQDMADLGENFYYAISTVQIAVILLVAPAATAGAICQDRAEGR